MVYKFIPLTSIVNELKIYYNSNINYSEIFDNLDEDIKNNLEILTDIIYINIVKKMDNTRQSLSFLDGVQKIDGIDCTFQFYINEKYVYANNDYVAKIGVIVYMVNNEYLGNINEILQDISILNFDTKDENEYKNTICNILFICHIIVNKFKYNPLFFHLYHEDDLKEMLNIRKRNIKLFGHYNECSVCYDQTIKYTFCNHYLCYKCYLSLEVKTCPMCRKCISMIDE